MPSGAFDGIAVVGLPRHDLPLDRVRGRLGDGLSVLLLTGGSTTMGPVSIPCVLLSEDLLLRLKPVIKSTLTDPSFIVLAGSCAIHSWRCADTEGVGEPGFVRRAGLWRVVFDVVVTCPGKSGPE